MMTSQFTNNLVESKQAFDFVAAHFECEANRYSEDNPNGFVNFGSAQNELHRDMIGCRLATVDRNDRDAHYQAFRGTEECREAVANYLTSQASLADSQDLPPRIDRFACGAPESIQSLHALVC